MSILIKGMEMPKDRPQLLWVYPNGKALTVQSDVDPWKELQAVPIPPHGKLIDADNIGLTNFEIILCQEGNPYKNALEMILKKIENAPAIIPADEPKEE